MCGPATVLHRPTGTIHDDATDQAIDCTQGGCNGADTGNNGYGDNLDCNKIIQAPANTLVSLDFSHMALEAGDACGAANNGVGCDIVTIYDGPNTQSPVLGTFSGNDVPERLISTGTALTVRFQTDVFTGKMVLHCHILEHEDEGMMLVTTITGTDGTLWTGAETAEQHVEWARLGGPVARQHGLLGCRFPAAGCPPWRGGAGQPPRLL